MGKLLNTLNKQLETKSLENHAEQCIEIYNWIKDNDKDGNVWSSKWTPLVDVTFIGTYPYQKVYKLNSIGRAVLKSIRNGNIT